MKQLTYWHANLKNANKTLLWTGSDNEEDWNNIIEKSKTNYLNSSQKKDLEYYIKNPINYKLNNYGFRTNDNLEKTLKVNKNTELIGGAFEALELDAKKAIDQAVRSAAKV